MVLVLVFLLSQSPAAEIESLVRDLGDDLIEVRERAHARISALGAPGIPALRKALTSPDAEVRLRAAMLLEVVEREDREHAHDTEQKLELLKLRRDVKAEGKPGSGATEGARFDLEATPFDGGWIVSSRSTDYLVRRHDEGPGRGRLRFDIGGISDADGKNLIVERCGRCSPAKVFVKAPPGPLKVRLTGHQVWFSPYDLEFQDPSDGQRKRVGDFTIEVAWPALRVKSGREFPEEWIPSLGGAFRCVQKEGIGLTSAGCGRSIG
jgi:hypothetical protein